MLQLDCFLDLAGLEALHADLDPCGSTVNNGMDMFQIGKKPAAINARYLLADAAFTLG